MKLTDFIKQLYGNKESMTLAELTQAANTADNAKFVDLKDGGYVDEGRYSDVSAKLTRANQTIRTLQQSVEAFEGVDVAELQRQLNQEKDGRKKDKQEWNLKAALSGAGCKDIDYVLWKLGQSVEFAEDGTLKDQEAVLTHVKEKYPTQFETQAPGGTGGAGNFPRIHEPREKTITREDYAAMTYNEKMKFKNEQPEAFETLKAQQNGGN